MIPIENVFGPAPARKRINRRVSFNMYRLDVAPHAPYQLRPANYFGDRPTLARLVRLLGGGA